jgi:peptidoglycan/xylan/chitin deacetylase (PgdA/CDA1 family)
VISIVTTSWDDGSILDLKVAELLDKYGLKGTFYLPRSLFAHPLGKSDVITLDRRFEVGAHTLNHVDLTRLPLNEANEEIAGSKGYLEDLLGHDVAMFCYPSGKYTRSIKNMVRDSGFVAARTVRRGNLAPPADPYEWGVTSYLARGLPHLNIYSWRKVCDSIKGLHDWEIRARTLFDRFLETGGIYHIWGHSLTFEIELQWEKLERLLEYIADREGICYATNGEIFTTYYPTRNLSK